MKRMNFKFFLIIVIVLFFSGCGLFSAYRRTQSDYMKTSNMLLSGGSKRMVNADWGEPNKKEILDNGGEIWSYENRQDNKNFIFYFTKKGKFVRVQICDPLECN